MNDQDSSEISSRLQMRLVVLRGEAKGKVFEIEEGSNLLGRWDPDQGAFPEIDLEEADLEAKVSRKHAILYRRGEQVTIEDLGSLNGTFINQGSRLEKRSPLPLKDGDEIVVGKTFLRFEVLEA